VLISTTPESLKLSFTRSMSRDEARFPELSNSVANLKSSFSYDYMYWL
jgi:hypothetical protein